MSEDTADIIQCQNQNGKRLVTSSLDCSPSLKKPYLGKSLQVSTTSTSSINNDKEDLNFLNEFDVDEIVSCLDTCETSLSDQSSVMTSPVKDLQCSQKQNRRKEPDKNVNTEQSQAVKNKDQSSHQDSLDAVEKKNIFKSYEKVLLNKSDAKEAVKLMEKMYRYFKENFTISSLLHNGNYSKIYKCRDTYDKEYAVKVLKNEAIKKHLNKEKEKLLLRMQADIPEKQYFSVRFKEGFTLRKKWCFVMEFFPKTLKQVLEELREPFNINVVQNLSRQIVDAVTVLRFNDIIHSDIKPSHILMNSKSDTLKLCGFDDAFHIERPNEVTRIGSHNYIAPEVILAHSCGFSIDVWSTATVMFEMATNKKLFQGVSNNDILYNHMSLLGAIPDKMLEDSLKRDEYFRGIMFQRKPPSYYSSNDDIILMNKMYIPKSYSISYYLNSTFKKYHYPHVRTKKEEIIYRSKIESFLGLMKQMLVLNPEDRITMEVAYEHPFVYEIF